MDSTATITDRATLEAVVLEQRDRIRELEAILGAQWRAPAVLALTPAEERILGALVSAKKRLNRDALYNAIYGSRHNPPEPGTINVLIHRVRKKLRAHAIQLTNTWAYGYEILPADAALLDALYVEGERA